MELPSGAVSAGSNPAGDAKSNIITIKSGRGNALTCGNNEELSQPRPMSIPGSLPGGLRPGQGACTGTVCTPRAAHPRAVEPLRALSFAGDREAAGAVALERGCPAQFCMHPRSLSFASDVMGQ